MRLSKSSLRLKESPLYGLFALCKQLEAQGREIIQMGVGEPDEDTPAVIREAGIRAIEEGRTRYVPAAGSAALKCKIAGRYGAETNEIVVSHGAKTVLGVALHCLVEAGDTVLIPAPYYPPFVGAADFLGAHVELIDTSADNFRLTAQAVRASLDNCRQTPAVLILNSPNNPAGTIYDFRELNLIADICDEAGITVISDECYAQFSRERDPSFRVLNPDAVIINSVSKTYSMTGWRIGWAVCPSPLAARMSLYLNNFIGCPSAVSEQAALEALDHEGLADFSAQRQIVHSWLEHLGVPFVKSDSGIYAWADFSQFTRSGQIGGSVALSRRILEEAGVAVTPGIAFGKQYDKYLRLAYPLEERRLFRALQKMEVVLEGMV